MARAYAYGKDLSCNEKTHDRCNGWTQGLKQLYQKRCTNGVKEISFVMWVKDKLELLELLAEKYSKTKGEAFQRRNLSNPDELTNLSLIPDFCWKNIKNLLSNSWVAKHIVGYFFQCHNLFKTNHKVFSNAEIYMIKLVKYAYLADETSFHTFFRVCH